MMSRFLKENYLEECDKEGRFLSEEDFEWSSTDKCLSEEEKSTIRAAQKWRKQLHSSVEKKGAFGSWRVLILLGGNRTAGFKRVLMAGGADITIHSGKRIDLSVSFCNSSPHDKNI
jgi:hypothetical protein